MGCESLPKARRLILHPRMWQCAWLLGVLLLAGCASLRVPDAPTMVPTEFLPTMIAMTIEARLTEDVCNPPRVAVEATHQPVNSFTQTTTPTRSNTVADP